LVDRLPPTAFAFEGVVMDLQSESIDCRLEGLKQDDQRMMFDSQLRAFRRDGESLIPRGHRALKPVRSSEEEYPVDQVVALLEELSRRIDGLEKKDRALADEIRRRARIDQCRRRIVMATELTGLAIFVTSWAMGWLDHGLGLRDRHVIASSAAVLNPGS
jgi:hypothetical protein